MKTTSSSMECELVLLEHFNEQKTVSNLKAATVICQNIFHLHQQEQMENKTAIWNHFESFCCHDNYTSKVPELCNQFLLEYGHNVKCGVPTKDVLYLDPLKPYDTATFILMSLLIPMGLIGNVLILYAILRLKCLPRQTGNFLSSLALADLGVMFQYGLSFMLYKSHANLPIKVETYMIPSLDIFFAAISLLQITGISIERAVAVTWPLKYPSYISARRSKIVVYIIWLAALFLFLFSMSRIMVPTATYNLAVFLTIASLLLFLPLIVIVVSYTMVLVCAYKNLSQDRKRIKMLTIFLRSNRRSNSADNESDTTSDTSMDKSTIWKRNSIRCREIKLAVNVAMIVLPFLGCWGFFLFTHIYELLTGHIFIGVINWLIPTLPFVVSCLNPILYLVLTRSLRKAVKSLIKRNVKSKLSRTEVSLLTLASSAGVLGNNNTNSRRTSSAVSAAGARKVGRDCTKDVYDLREQLLHLAEETSKQDQQAFF